MSEFFSFRKLIAPTLIHIIFWIGTGAAVIGGIAVIISSTRYYFQPQAILGVLLLFLGPVIMRLWAELLTAFFHMHGFLSDIRDVAVREAYERYEETQNGNISS